MKLKKITSHLPVLAATVGLGMLAACSTTPLNNAPVVERAVNPPAQEKAVAVHAVQPAPKPAEVSRAQYLVKRGDTLYRIALDHGQSYNDLVAWNNLKNPNDIKVDQVLRVSPPDGESAQTGSVSLPGAAEARPLVPVNPATNKTSPRGEKRPYSEAALAELQKADSGVPAPVPKPETAPVAKAKEKTPEGAAAEHDAIEWMWPVDGKLLAGYDDVKNKGFDIGGKMGQEVFAAAAGKVMYAGSGIRGYGNIVIIKHTDILLSAYAHNKSILVKEGQAIAKGQKIAEMGNSDSDTVKLHFEIRQQGKPVDPSRYLPGR